MKTRYQMPRDMRMEARDLGGKMRGGKLMPILAQPFRPSESGMIQTTVNVELDPIEGRMGLRPYFELIAVYVPVQAMHALLNPEHDYPGNAEVVRKAMLEDSFLFGVEPEGELSMRMGVNPRSVDGTKYVSVMPRLAHNCAVNYLRRKKYHKAAQILANSTAITPAIVSQTALDMLNGVLDPEDRVNGRIEMPLTGRIDVSGIGFGNSGVTPRDTNRNMRVAAPPGEDATEVYPYGDRTADGFDKVFRMRRQEGDTGIYMPDVYVDLAEADGAALSATDLYQARRTDRLVRDMAGLVQEYQEYGQEILARFAAGLNLDPGKQPFEIYSRRVPFGRSEQGPMDGASLFNDVLRTDMAQTLSFAVPVPANEFGGIVVTFACLKPDESLLSQPHPILSQEWGADNFLADEIAVDPQPVNIRELWSDCEQADENTVALYMGNNHLKKNYIHYGWNRQVDPTTVESKTNMWQYQLPVSVDPETVLYPEYLDHYPFSDHGTEQDPTEVCTYRINSIQRVQTPTIFGPTPVEELEEIENEDLFEDAE